MDKVKVAILKQYNFVTLFIKFFQANTENCWETFIDHKVPPMTNIVGEFFSTVPGWNL